MLYFTRISIIFLTLYMCIVNNVLADDEDDPAVTTSLLQNSLILDATRYGNRYLAAGEHGLVFTSVNNENWRVLKLPEGITLTAVLLHDTKLGWVAGHDAAIYRTVNGGETWKRVYYAPDEEAPLLDLWFDDDLHGFAIGAYGLYLKSTDGGVTWRPEEMKIINSNDQDIDTGQDYIDELAEFYELHLNSIAQSDNGKLYIVAEAGRVYRSDNLGETWQELPSPYSGSLFGVLPLQNDNLLVYGLRGHLFRSEDGGNSWHSVDTGIRELLSNAIQLHDGKIVVVGMGGTVLSSDDNGKSFSLKQTGYRHGYSAIIEISHNELILVGDHGMAVHTRKELGINAD